MNERKYYLSGKEEYDSRFLYFTIDRFYFRETKDSWKKWERVGNFLKRVVYKIDELFPRTYIDYLGKKAKANPYGRRRFSAILWWIRKNLTFD